MVSYLRENFLFYFVYFFVLSGPSYHKNLSIYSILFYGKIIYYFIANWQLHIHIQSIMLTNIIKLFYQSLTLYVQEWGGGGWMWRCMPPVVFIEATHTWKFFTFLNFLLWMLLCKKCCFTISQSTFGTPSTKNISDFSALLKKSPYKPKLK